MSCALDKDPKQRILDAAISLFAKRGFAAVGVREIAAAAEVNIAMISYYFVGKGGILKAIVEEFFSQYSQLLGDVDDQNKTPEECLRVMIQRMVDYVGENTELAMVVYNELPLDIPEIAEIKAERIIHLIDMISGLVRRFGLDPKDTLQMSMIGPSLLSMILTNFRLRPVIQHVLEVKFNQAYYERLIETLATLFLDGIHGVSAHRRKQRGRK
jgi:AcrR family transcriptional regulator